MSNDTDTFNTFYQSEVLRDSFSGNSVLGAIGEREVLPSAANLRLVFNWIEFCRKHH